MVALAGFNIRDFKAIRLSMGRLSGSDSKTGAVPYGRGYSQLL